MSEERKAYITAEQSATDDYVADYVCSTDGADYTPTDFERALVEDALNGFNAEREQMIAARTPTPPSDAADHFANAGKPIDAVSNDVVERVVEELTVEGQAKHDYLNSYQRAAADDEARAFYRKVINRYRAAISAYNGDA